MLILVLIIVLVNKVVTIADIKTIIIIYDYNYRGKASYIIVVGIRVF